MANSTKDVRLSGPTLRLLKAVLENPKEGLSGAQISKITNIGSGTLYPILFRLEEAGWLESQWEKIDPTKEGRPRRRFYKLTGQGHTKSVQALAELQTAPGALQWN